MWLQDLLNKKVWNISAFVFLYKKFVCIPSSSSPGSNWPFACLNMLTFKFQEQTAVSQNKYWKQNLRIQLESWKESSHSIYRYSHEPKEYNPNFKKSCFAKAKNEVTGFQYNASAFMLILQ